MFVPNRRKNFRNSIQIGRETNFPTFIKIHRKNQAERRRKNCVSLKSKPFELWFLKYPFSLMYQD